MYKMGINQMCLVCWMVTIYSISVARCGECNNPRQIPEHGVPYFAVGGNTVISHINNATGLNWFNASRQCGNKGGRLFWFGGNESIPEFVNTSNRGNFSRIYIGRMIVSDKNETSQSIQEGNITCPKEFHSSDSICTNNRSATANTSCDEFQCCVEDNGCFYPALVVAASHNPTATRQCLGIRKTGHSTNLSGWEWFQHNCNEKGDFSTGFSCEQPCTNTTSWPKVEFPPVYKEDVHALKSPTTVSVILNTSVSDVLTTATPENGATGLMGGGQHSVMWMGLFGACLSLLKHMLKQLFVL